MSIRDEREPQSALARWDAAEAFHGERLVQPLVEDQSRFCLHPSADHGTLGCNTCGCPRSEDDHLGGVCRWPEPEDAKARDPWVWRPGLHTDRFPHGMAFEPKKAEPGTFAPWGSVANLMGEPRNNVALLFALGPEGEKLDDPLELLGPFHMLREDGRLVEFIAWGGLLVDHQARTEPQCHEATGLWITKYNADGTLGETVHLPDTKATVCFAPPEESAMARAARTFGPPLAQMAITFTQTIGPACRALVDMLAGVHPFKGRTGKVPPCRGLTRRQRAARRRIHRRRSR